LISLALTAVLAAAVYLLWSVPVFRVADAQITGLARLDPAEINSALGLRGQWIFLLRPDEIATRLRLQFPELSSAQVVVALPNLVEINVTERQPVLLWQQGNGYTWIDTDGIAFKPRGDSSGLLPVAAAGAPPAGEIPPADSLTPPTFMAPDLVKTALALASSVPPGITLTYDPAYGFGWTDPRGWQVFFGTTSRDMPLKLRVYQSLVDSLAARGVTPALISVVHADAPYYRMEP
jgi:cell division protein FtsQ